MPQYKVSFRQAIEFLGVPQYKWSNSFNIAAINAQEAATQGAGLWQTRLRSAVRQFVYCYEVYATDRTATDGNTPTTQDFATVAVLPGFQRGLIVQDADNTSLYWRDVVLNVELLVPNQRPDRKYWRPGLLEEDFDRSGTFTNTVLLGQIQTAFNGLLLEEQVVDGDGSLFTFARVTKSGVRRLGRQARFEVPAGPPLG